MSDSEELSSLFGALATELLSLRGARSCIGIGSGYKTGGKVSALVRVISVAWVLAISDYRYSNKQTRVGVLWPTLGLAIRMLAIATVFSAAFNQEKSFPVLIATGLVCWQLLNDLTTSSVTSYSRAKGLMMSIPLPPHALPLRNLLREVLFFGQNLVLVLFVLLALDELADVRLDLFLLGLLLVLPSLLGIAWLVAILSAQFPDVGKLISSIMQVLFFVTPVIWDSRHFPEGIMSLIVQINPFYHLLNVFRLPLMGDSPTLANYLVVSLGGGIALVTGFWLVSRQRNKILRWLG